MHELALFAGAGGGLLATKWLLGWRTVCYVENAEYPVKVLEARIRDGLLDDAPIWGDVRTFDGRPWRGCVDIVTAGFPCQPFSQAGKGRAEKDERNLWPDTIRVIREVEPEWVLLENVPRLLCHDYVRRIFGDLAESGYDCRWDCVPASAIGANHQRDRLWIVGRHTESHPSRALGRIQKGKNTEPCGICQDVAYTKSCSTSRQSESDKDTRLGLASSGEGQPGAESFQDVGHAAKSRLERAAGQEKPRAGGVDVKLASGSQDGWWATEPAVGRVAHGVAHRVDRLKALGNGQVPAVVATVWRLLTEGMT